MQKIRIQEYDKSLAQCMCSKAAKKSVQPGICEVKIFLSASESPLTRRWNKALPEPPRSFISDIIWLISVITSQSGTHNWFKYNMIKTYQGLSTHLCCFPCWCSRKPFWCMKELSQCMFHLAKDLWWCKNWSDPFYKLRSWRFDSDRRVRQSQLYFPVHKCEIHEAPMIVWVYELLYSLGGALWWLQVNE